MGGKQGKTEGTFSNRALLALILPLIAEQFLAVLVGMADTVMVSGVGESAVAAVSTVDALNTLFIQLFTAMSAGGAVVAAQYLGRQDRENACGAAKQLILSTALLATLVSALTLIFHCQIIGLMDNNSDPATTAQSYTYLLITALSFPFLGIYNGGVGLMRAMGNSKASMWTSIAMNIINIGGNALLIHPCGLGVAGAGIATLASRAVSAAIILRLMFNQHMPIHLAPIRKPREYFRLDFRMIRRIFRVGIPNGLENSLFQLGKVLIMGIITTFPTALRAANGICGSISSIVNIPGGAIGLAAIAVIGQLVGAGKKEEARRYGRKLLGLMYLGVLPLNLALLFLAEPVAGHFPALPGGGARVGADLPGIRAVFHFHLGALLRHAQYPSRRGGRALHHARLRGQHAAFAAGGQLSAGVWAGDVAAGGVAGHARRLDRPGRILRGPLLRQ